MDNMDLNLNTKSHNTQTDRLTDKIFNKNTCYVPTAAICVMLNE